MRLPNAKEMKATKIIKIPLTEASAKIRTGPPVDDKPDYELPIWAGVLPIRTVFDSPISDPKLADEIAVSQSVIDLKDSNNG